MTAVFCATLLLPVASSCEVAEAVGFDRPSLTLGWTFDESRCDLLVSGRVTEQGRIRFSAKLACSAAKPTVRQASLRSARL